MFLSSSEWHGECFFHLASGMVSVASFHLASGMVSVASFHLVSGMASVSFI